MPGNIQEVTAPAPTFRHLRKAVILGAKWVVPGTSHLESHTGSTPGSERSPGGGHGNPLQYSCLENPMDRGAWWATVRRVTKSQTWLKCLSTHAQAQVPSHLEFSRMLNALDGSCPILTPFTDTERLIHVCILSPPFPSLSLLAGQAHGMCPALALI